jgi:small-conductance mechanosensitive channel
MRHWEKGARLSLVLLTLLAGLLSPTFGRTQPVDWLGLLNGLNGGESPPMQSRADPRVISRLERNALETPMPPSTGGRTITNTTPTENGASPVQYSQLSGTAATTAGGTRPSSASDDPLEAYAAAGARPERPPDLEAYGQLANQFGNRIVNRTAQSVDTFRGEFGRYAARVPAVPAMLHAMLRDASPTGEAGYFLELLGVIAAMLLGGRALIGVLGPLIGLPIMRAAQRRFAPEGMTGKLPVLVARVLTTMLVTIISFGATALIALEVLDETRNDAATASVVLASGFSITYAVIDAMWRMVLSPYLPEYRLPKIEDEPAKRLYVWLSACVGIGLLGESLIIWMEELGGEPALIVISAIALRLVAVMAILAMIIRNSTTIASAIRGGRKPHEANWLAAGAAVVAPPLVSIYFVAAWLEGSVRLVLNLSQGLPLFIGPFVTLMTSLLVYAVGSYAVELYFQRGRRREARRQARAAAETRRAEARRAAEALEARERASVDATDIQRARDEVDEVDEADDDARGDDDDEGGGNMPTLPEAVRTAENTRAPVMDRHGMRTFEDLGHRVASLVAGGVGLYMLVRIWAGPGVFHEDSFGGWVDDIVDKLLIGYIAYHAARIWLDRKIDEETAGMPVMAEPGDEGGGASASSRLATLLPLLRSFVLVIIGASVLVLVAMDFGLNVAPLFAGAGIVGLALGFGAQTLVRDILSGVFFLLDDAFRKGEYIDVGEVKGTVEKISLRSFQLRHHLGALNTIPFGEIKHLTNFSRDWVMMKLPLRLTYDTDIDKVRKLIKKLGEKLLEHPTEGHKFVQPLKSQGVYMMEDSAMIIRVKFMTRPGDQWTTRKLVYQEIRNLFEQEGIKFAHREVTVRTPDLPDNPTRAQIQQAGAAARQAVENIEGSPTLSALSEAR